MSQSVPAVTTAEIGAASWFLGAGIGYAIAPRKYGLEQILTKSDDVFEKALPVKSLLKGTEDEQVARKTLATARHQLKTAFEHNAFEGKLNELMHAPNIANAFNTVKNYIPHARYESAIVFGTFAAGLSIFVKMLSKSNN